MYLYGASGHAKVIMDIVRASGMSIDGLVDDNPELEQLQGYPVFHDPKGLTPFIVSIGANAIRKKVVERLSAEYGVAIHPTAVISSSATIGVGTVVMQGTVIQADARIGKHCIVNTGASVDHECVVEDYAHLSPHATLCGNVRVGEGTWVGAGAIVIPGVRIGRWCVIGAGTVVAKDVPDGWLAYGNTCRLVRQINKDMLNRSDGGGKNLTVVPLAAYGFTLSKYGHAA